MNKINKFFTFSIIFSIIFYFNIATSFASQTVENFVDNMKNESLSILENNKLTEKQKEEKYKAFTNKIIDTKWVSRFILGKNWNQLTPAQQKSFEELYTKYLLTNYISKLKDYNKDLKTIKVEKSKEGVFMVYTKTKDNLGKVVNVNFRLIENNNSLFITDIIPEGISFIGSQRTDIGSSIEKKGFDEFMIDLANKVK